MAVDGPLLISEILFETSYSKHVYPIMDFVISDFPLLEELLARKDAWYHRPCREGEHDATCVPSEVLQVPGIYWVDTSWVDLVQVPQLPWDSLHMTQKLDLGGESVGYVNCDDANTQEDEEFIDSIFRSLEGQESLALETNEFRFTDFFVRHIHSGKLCDIGVATLFLIAADITAYAAAARSEYMRWVVRAIAIAQSIVHQYVGNALDRFRGIFYTRWPIWRLLQSIALQLHSGIAANLRHDFIRLRSGVTPTSVPDEEEVYLSLVMEGRNDDYAMGMLDRLNRMLETSTAMLSALGLPSEIIIVDWNPPLSRAPLADAIRETIRRTPGSEVVPIRIVTVPTEVHMQVPHHKAHALFDLICANVGLRRARGKWILKTNIDNILSPAVMKFIARQQLEENTVYRATYLEQWVNGPEVDARPPPYDLLDWLFNRDDLLEQANRRLQDVQASYPEDQGVCEGLAPSEHASRRDHPPYFGFREDDEPRFYGLGSGDFVLASRELVFRVHGYPQVSQNWQVDDLIHCRFRAVGAKQVVLHPPCVTVHQNHVRVNRVRSSTRWVVTDRNFHQICDAPFNVLPTESGLEDDWGFPDAPFFEAVI